MRFHPAWKIVGLLIATFLLWLTVASFSYHSFTVTLPVTPTNLRSDLAIADNLTQINVVVRAKGLAGYRQNVAGLVTASVELGSIAETGKYHVAPTFNVKMKQCWIASFSPTDFDINVVPSVTMPVTLSAEVLDFPALGFTVNDVQLSPNSVVVTGPADLSSSFMSASVPISVAHKNSSFTIFGSPEIKDAKGKPMTNFSFSPNNISVSVNITRGDNFKTVGLDPTFSGSLPAGRWLSSIEFSPPALTIKGNPQKLSEILSLKTTPIKLTDKFNSFTDKISVDLPAGISLVEPNIVDAKLNIGLSSQNRSLTLIPAYNNVTNGLAVDSVSPPTVTVVLSGATDQLSNLNRLNTILNLDLKGALTGSNTITLTKEMFKVPNNIEVISFDPPTLEVVLSKTS